MDQVDSPVIEYKYTGTHNTQKVKEAYFCILSSEFPLAFINTCSWLSVKQWNFGNQLLTWRAV